MEKAIFALLVSVCFICVTICFAYAGSGSGKITGLFTATIGNDSLLFIKTESLSGTPSCNYTTRFVMKSADPSFKSMVAVAITAYASGETVTAVGLGTCNSWDNSEDLQYIVLGSIPY
jgi:hypothetical protein